MMARTDENHLISGFQPGGLVHRIPQPGYTGGCSHQRKVNRFLGKIGPSHHIPTYPNLASVLNSGLVLGLRFEDVSLQVWPSNQL